MKLLAFCTALLVAAPAFADTITKADADKFIAFYDKLADGVVADKGNCSKMATDMNAAIDANKAILDAANNAMKAGKRMPDDALHHVMDTSKRMTEAMMEKNCHQDKGVQAALLKLPNKKH